LERRRLGDTTIASRIYSSTNGAVEICAELAHRFDIEGIPGFFDISGHWHLNFHDEDGGGELLIPVCDARGWIVAIQIRRGNEMKQAAKFDQVINALLSCPRIEEAARQCGISRTTLWRLARQAADESRSVTTPPEFNTVSPPVEAFKICAPPKATFAAFPPPNTTIAAS
jgi:hypothetical protein